jgi:hypothetical protein
MRNVVPMLAVVASSLVLAAQTTPPQAARAYTTPRQAELTRQFEEFLSIPNVAADPAGLRRNADFLVTQLQQRGAEAKLLTAPGLPGSVPPVVFGEIKTPGAKRTIVFYAHYDGQPVTPSEWDTGKPFTPVVKEVAGEPRTAPSRPHTSHSKPTSASSGREKKKPAPPTSNKSSWPTATSSTATSG